MRLYRCTDVEIYTTFSGGPRLGCTLLDNHSAAGASAGHRVTTSPLRTIDFERGIATTKSGSTYVWEPKETK